MDETCICVFPTSGKSLVLKQRNSQPLHAVFKLDHNYKLNGVGDVPGYSITCAFCSLDML